MSYHPPQADLFSAAEPAVRLTDAQWDHAKRLGQTRTLRIEAQGIGGSVRPADGLLHRTRAAAAEIVVAQRLGIFYRGDYDDTNGEDVGPVQVRSTVYDGGCLILRPQDRERYRDRPWVCVTGELPVLTVRGWIMGRDAWRLRIPARGADANPLDAWVPQYNLRPIDELAERLECDRGVWRFLDDDALTFSLTPAEASRFHRLISQRFAEALAD